MKASENHRKSDVLVDNIKLFSILSLKPMILELKVSGS